MRIARTLTPVRNRGMLVLSASVAQFPKSSNSAATGGTQTGIEGVIKKGDFWVITSATGRKLTGMPSNFAFPVAVVIAAKNNAGNTYADWIVSESGVTSALVNQSPTVFISSPTGGTVEVGDTVSVVFSAQDADGTIANVKLLVNNVDTGLTPVGNTFQYTPSTTGSKDLAVQVTDNQGAVALSAPVTISAVAPVATPTLVRQINLGDDPRTFDGVTYESYKTGSTPSNVTADTIYFNTTPIAQGDLSPAVSDAAQYQAIKSFGYNLRNMVVSGLTNGNYRVQLVVLRLYNTALSPLIVNNQTVQVQTQQSGPYWPEYSVDVVVSDGTITLHDTTTATQTEGSIALSYIRIYSLS